MKWTDKLYQKITVVIAASALFYNIFSIKEQSKKIEETYQDVNSINSQLLAIANSNKNINQSSSNNLNKAENNNTTNVNVEPILMSQKDSIDSQKQIVFKEDYQVIKFDSLVTCFFNLVGQLDDRASEFYFSSNIDSIEKERKKNRDSLSLHNHNILAQLERAYTLIDLTAKKLDSTYLNKALEIKKKLNSLKRNRLY